MNIMRLCAAGLLSCAAFASAALAQDAARGKALFAAECAACHSAQPGQNGVGPSLAGVYGRPAGTVPGYHFSPALRQTHIILTATELDLFLRSPSSFAAGTKMPTPGSLMHMGVPNAADRGDLIAYLRDLRSD